MRQRHALDLTDAQRVVDAALAHAGGLGWRVTVAVVDDGGVPLLLLRMDEASPASVATAIEKARSAALTGLDTKLLEAMIEKRPGTATIGRVAVEGGLPLLHDGQRVGGIGVSGLPSHQDAEVAAAGQAAFAGLPATT